MNAKEKDELLIRLDERTANTWRVVESLEKHNAEQNGILRETMVACSKNTAWRKSIVVFGGLIIGAVAGWMVKIQWW